jgi:alkylhydroperoxidase family enzyme
MELITQLSIKGIDDRAYEEARTHLSEQEIVELTVAIGAINTWNRVSVAFRSQHGSLDKMRGLEKAGLN